MTDASTYWFRVPDDEVALMALSPAQLKCYLVVMRAIQRDKNAGRISARQVAERAQIRLRHAHEAIRALVEAGRIVCEPKPGATAVYSIPFMFAGNCSPTGEQLNEVERVNRTPTGKQSAANCTPVGEQHCTPVGEQHCTPVGEQHLESLEKHTHPAQSSGVWADSGWDSAEDFETWFGRVIWKHPNKNRNAVAKTKAMEMLTAGTLNRAEFEAGYEALRIAAGVRWTEENGRYAPNLWQLLDDQAWKFAPAIATPMPVVSEYQNADDYARRIQAE